MEKFPPNRSNIFYEKGALYKNGKWNKLVLEIYLFQFQNHIIELPNSQLFSKYIISQGNVLFFTICETHTQNKNKKGNKQNPGIVITAFIDWIKILI